MVPWRTGATVILPPARPWPAVGVLAGAHGTRETEPAGRAGTLVDWPWTRLFLPGAAHSARQAPTGVGGPQKAGPAAPLSNCPAAEITHRASGHPCMTSPMAATRKGRYLALCRAWRKAMKPIGNVRAGPGRRGASRRRRGPSRRTGSAARTKEKTQSRALQAVNCYGFVYIPAPTPSGLAMI